MIDLTGVNFGWIIAVCRVDAPKGKKAARGPYWRCDCTRCGNDCYVATSGDLRSGRIQSCGCYRNSQEFADKHVVHGQRRQLKGNTSYAYKSWCEMKRRCNDPSRENYKWYGGKGISYDPRWESFVAFYEDMGECPPGRELGRRKHNENYSKDNCDWEEISTNRQSRGISR